MANVIKHKRGSGSDPTASDLVVGEVAIRTDVGKLFTKMDNGSVAEIAGGGSDIAINTLSASSSGSGASSFNSSENRFQLSSPPSVSAQQLLVSVNGVIQKPVPGTGTPSEGFSVDGNDIIFSSPPETGADFFILTFKSLGVSEPADNSVTSAKIVDGAIVNADINASAAIAGTKISPNFGSQAITTTGNLNAKDIILTDTDPSITFTDSDDNPDYRIFASAGRFKLKDATNNVDRVTLDSSGRVGIGTSSPDRLLHVVGSDCRIRLSDSDVSPDVELQNSSGDGVLTTNSTTNLRFNTNNTERMRIDSSGLVGIGTSSPARGPLHVHNNSSSDCQIHLTNDDTGATSQDGLTIFTDTDTSGIWSRENVDFQIATNNTERLRISASGNVGIGTTSPARLLSLQNSSDFGIRLTKTAASDAEIKNTNSLDLCCSSGGSGGQIIRMLTGANPSSLNEVMRVDGGQKVAIGTTTTTEKLIVAGAIDFTGAATGNTANSGKLSYESGTAFLQSKGPDTSTRGKIGFNIAHSDGSSGITVLTIDTSGNVVPDDSLNVLSTLRTQGQTFVKLTGHNTSNFSVMVFGVNSGGHNTGSCAVALGKHSTNNRSLNAAGTVNASGNDYAEYMTKSSDFTLAKGDICGIDANGKLTNKFSESISFVVKSTDPSYVGGDAWGTEEVLGEKPADDSDDLPAYEEKYEAARKMVDRIAFSGQVPVNVTGTTPGQHIIPTAGSGDAITGVAKAEKDLSITEYMSSIGKVIGLEPDGRAKIIVKVA